MKKLFFILTLLILIFSLSACGIDAPKENSAQEAEIPQVQTPEEGNFVTEEAISFFKSIPGEFVFSVGAGGWQTVININEDGTFTGKHTDNEFTTIGEGYPEGSIYICEFTGKFSEPVMIEENLYSSTIEKLDYNKNTDDFYIKDGIKYIYSIPFGLENADKITFFLPGASGQSLPEEARDWFFDSDKIKETVPEDLYLIMNPKDFRTFVGYKTK